jgi:hypothetical protein
MFDCSFYLKVLKIINIYFVIIFFITIENSKTTYSFIYLN